MTAPKKMAHIVFRTNQLQTMIDWYCEVLSAHVVFGNGKLAFLTYDEEHHRIALIATQPFVERPEQPHVGFYHSAFTYESLEELFATFQRLRDKGISPWRVINHGLTISLYYRDPDGNDVELQVDRFEDARDAVAWMQGEAFSHNPIGIEFDPELMIAALAAGTPKDQLMRRADE